MSLLLETAIKMSLLVGVALMGAAMLRRRSAALRHWILSAAIVTALVMPVLMQVAPSWNLPIAHNTIAAPQPARARESVRTSNASPRVATTITADVEIPSQTNVSLVSLVLVVWLAGVAVRLGGLALGLWTLTRIAARATVVADGPWARATHALEAHYGLRTPVRLLHSNQPALLVTWGLFAPKVMLPADADTWAEDRIHVVLAHELAHVRRGDWTVQIAGEVLLAIHWFNPLMWVACSRLRQESERACDDEVVNLGVEGSQYAVHLLELARQFAESSQRSLPAVAIAPRPSGLHRRISAMLNTQISRRPVSLVARLGTAAALLAVALPIALFAQNTFATVSGSLMDQSGALLPGATVVVTDKQRGAKHEVRTDRTGSFELVGLPQGSYTLEAVLPGFETVRQTLTMSGQDVARDITMSLGRLNELIVVTNTPNAPSDRPAPKPGTYKRPACTPGTPEANTAASGTRRIGGQIRVPVKFKHVSPVYPEGSSAGIVKLDTVIGTDGYVKDVTLTNDAAPALARAAEDAVRQWVFDQTLLNCVPVDVRMAVVVEFR